MKNIIKYLFLTVLLPAIISCQYEFPETERTGEFNPGEVDNSKIVAAGDGFMGGVMDGALYTSGQINSLAGIIASQVNAESGAAFVQPAIHSQNGLNLYAEAGNNSYGKWILSYSNPYQENPKRSLTTGEQLADFEGDKGSLNDLTLPLLTTAEINNQLLGENPFFGRISTGNIESYTPLVIEKSPTLVLCWLGMNDYLRYAMQGASGGVELTTPEEFRSAFNSFMDAIINSTESKIVVGNLIPITDLPFFYLKHYNFLRLDNPAKAAAQNRYAAFNAAVAAHNVGKPAGEKRPFISFEDNGATLYPQPLVVEDNSLPDAFYPDGSPLEKYRQLKEGEMALLSITEQMVSNGYGSIRPLPQQYFLTSDQIESISSRAAAFNQIINQAANENSNRVIVADVKSEIAEIVKSSKTDAWGIPESDSLHYSAGVPVEAGLSKNSIFSLDAIHFNQRGNAFVANIFIEAINQNFYATIPEMDINEFTGNVPVFLY